MCAIINEFDYGDLTALLDPLIYSTFYCNNINIMAVNEVSVFGMHHINIRLLGYQEDKSCAKVIRVYRSKMIAVSSAYHHKIVLLL